MMYFPKELKETPFIQEVMDELRMVTVNGGIKSKHDDCLDMISQLEQMNLILPSKEESKINNVVDIDKIDSMIYYGKQELDLTNYESDSSHSCSDYLV